ncbi:dna double-strand break repair protein mre11 [hydrocarbon metagenome]|uniref:Dna double-strand break repair protein mre11 n=1 Tax=hydrocarbon metagenome TaxID=938273 RepID=A0A0W8E5S4_9ZZZZ
MKFIHAADIHLDSPLTGLENYEGAPVDLIRGASRKALSNLVKLALEEGVDFVIIAGDLYDGDWRDVSTGMYFNRQMLRLKDRNIKVFIIKGNHDAASNISSNLPLPENVIEFSSRSVQTYRLDELQTVIHGQSFKTRAVTDNLAQGYPLAEPGCFNIGMLHSSLTGREGHEVYAPCSEADLCSRGYDYWALGHIHKREIVCAGDPCWIVFPGNIQGRFIRETGDKGCTLVEVIDKEVVSVDHFSLDVMRWVECQVDTSGMNTPAEVLIQVKDEVDSQTMGIDMPAAVRVLLRGECKASYDLLAYTKKWSDSIRALIMNSRPDIWVEKVKFDIQPPAIRTYDSLVFQTIAELVAYYDSNPEAREELFEDILQDIANLPGGELWEELKSDPQKCRDILLDTESLLIGILSGGAADEDQ